MKKITFECPHCGNFTTRVNLTMDSFKCSLCNIKMCIGFVGPDPRLYIGHPVVFYRFHELFGYALINIESVHLSKHIGYYIDDYDKYFFKLKAARDFMLKESLINPNLKLAKQGTYKPSNDLSQIIKEVTEYIESTNSDKYGDSPLNDMLGPDGKAINTFQIKKYLTRYKTTGFKKSELRSDLLKIIHYAMFELKRTKSKC